MLWGSRGWSRGSPWGLTPPGPPGDPQEQLVRHFLIETGPRGVKIRGCPEEPYFGEGGTEEGAGGVSEGLGGSGAGQVSGRGCGGQRRLKGNSGGGLGGLGESLCLRGVSGGFGVP